jgi:RNA polymerase sigma-70 factor (ECF subfamily)
MALMKRVQDGDAEAYRALLDDIRPALLHLLRSWAADPDDLQDLVQDALMAFHRARHSYDPSRPLEPWLFAVTRHVALSHRRRNVRRTSWQILVDDPPERPDNRAAGPGPEPQLEGVLAHLSPGQREAFELLKLEGLSVEEAARRVGTTTGALKVRAHRAYQTIRRLLARE